MPSEGGRQDDFGLRLLLLGAAVVAGALVLGARLWWLTVARGAVHLASAESRLVERRWIGASRGRILDRAGRVLAVDRPAFDIAVEYGVIAGQWPAAEARTRARRLAGVAWSAMSEPERERLAGPIRDALAAHLERAWATLAQSARVSRETLDEACAAVRRTVESRRDVIVARRLEKARQGAGERGELITPELDRAMVRAAEREILEQTGAHPIISRVEDVDAFEIDQLAGRIVEIDVPLGEESPLPGQRSVRLRVDRLPGVRVVDAGDRAYPMDAQAVELDRSTFPTPLRSNAPLAVALQGVGAHVIGWTRHEVHAEDIAARHAVLRSNPDLATRAILDEGAVATDRGEYRDGDSVGAAGVEASRESELRGLRGVRYRHLDSGQNSELAPEPGRDVRLTIDIRLQARVEAAMSRDAGLAVVQRWHAVDQTVPGAPQPIAGEPGTPLNGAAVVLDIDTGEIVAMTSTPSISRSTLKEHPELIFNDAVDAPYLNRAINAAYQPGSIVKAIILPEAVSRGVYRLDQSIACTGHFLPDQPGVLNCWIYKRFGTTHSEQLGHDPGPSEAIMVSCNIFFFTLGRRLGPQDMADAFADFGVGTPYNLGIGPEFPGRFGAAGRDVTPGDAVQAAIGQGPVAWTPLHAADALATLARGGVRIPPRIIAGEPLAPERTLPLDADAVGAALEGLRLAVNDERGTGEHLSIDGEREPVFNVQDVSLWGKTGTADASPLVVDPDGDGPEPRRVVRDGDHSWFVVLAGRAHDRPRFAVAVVIDYGGSGGKVSGPIANQIVHALVEEGLL